MPDISSLLETTVVENGVLRATAASLGAELMSVQKISPDGNPVEFLWNGDAKHWNGRAPILFPIVGRVKNGVYVYRGKTYEIEIPHGFFQSARLIRDKSENPFSMAFVLESNDATLRQYPFPFRFRVEYSLHENTLQVVFDLLNTGKETMPFSLGFHPGFNVPLEPDERLDDCSLCFEAEETPRRLLLDGVFMSGKSVPFPLKERRVIPLSRSLFADDAVILDNVQKRSVSLCNSRHKPYLTVDYSDFRYLAIWQPPKNSPPFLCLETWNGLPDDAGTEIADLASKPGMISLAPGKHYTAKIFVRFH